MTDPTEQQDLARLLRLLVPRLLAVLLAGAVVVALVAPLALRIGLGPDYVSAAPAIRLACVAVPGYALFVSLRSVLDAAFHRPVTMIYAVYAFACFLVSYLALRQKVHENAVMVAFSIGIWVLALLAARRTQKLLAGVA